MSPNRKGGRYAHRYSGKKNSRGQRTISKIHKGVQAVSYEKLLAALQKTK